MRSTKEYWQTRTLDDIVNERVNFLGYIELSLMAQNTKWADEMLELFNQDAVSVEIDPDSKTFYDWKHGSGYYPQPTKSTWNSYCKWMKKTWGLDCTNKG